MTYTRAQILTYTHMYIIHINANCFIIVLSPKAEVGCTTDGRFPDWHSALTLQRRPRDMAFATLFISSGSMLQKSSRRLVVLGASMVEWGHASRNRSRNVQRLYAATCWPLVASRRAGSISLPSSSPFCYTWWSPSWSNGALLFQKKKKEGKKQKKSCLPQSTLQKRQNGRGCRA